MASNLKRIQPFEQPTQFAGRQLQNLLDGLRPGEAVPLQSLLPETKSVVIPIQNLDDAAVSVAKGEQMSGKDVHLQMLSHQQRQPIDGKRKGGPTFTAVRLRAMRVCRLSRDGL